MHRTRKVTESSKQQEERKKVISQIEKQQEVAGIAEELNHRNTS
jgi:hypothetical protein